MTIRVAADGSLSHRRALGGIGRSDAEWRVGEKVGLGEMRRRRTLCWQGEYRHVESLRHRMKPENWGEKGSGGGIGLTV
jgi:hypothetical protein